MKPLVIVTNHSKLRTWLQSRIQKETYSCSSYYYIWHVPDKPEQPAHKYG